MAAGRTRGCLSRTFGKKSDRLVGTLSTRVGDLLVCGDSGAFLVRYHPTRLLTLRFGELEVNPMGDRNSPTRITRCGLEIGETVDGSMMVSQRDCIDRLPPLKLAGHLRANRD